MSVEVEILQMRRFTVEEIDNGWLVKISLMGSDKLVGRYAFASAADLLQFIKGSILKRDVP